jgi:hypothetical protein
MNINTCYWCNYPIDILGYCFICKNKHDLKYVYTGYINIKDEGNLKYCSEIGLIINDIHYNIMLEFCNLYSGASVNETIICEGGRRILTLSGYPLAPANVKEKLKSYLVFS